MNHELHNVYLNIIYTEDFSTENLLKLMSLALYIKLKFNDKRSLHQLTEIIQDELKLT